jgi:hypothetical protein
MKQDLVKKFYYTILYAWYTLYAIALLGIASVAPAYLDTLNSALKYFIIAFLLVRFNPWANCEMTAFDRTVVFSAAFFLLASTTIASIMQSYMHFPTTSTIY